MPAGRGPADAGGTRATLPLKAPKIRAVRNPRFRRLGPPFCGESEASAALFSLPTRLHLG